jgi:D-sedoheptulose 7-phosphate isomerase
MTTTGAGTGPDGMEILYPFLYPPGGDAGPALDAAFDEVRQSTTAKVREAVRLRQLVLERDGERLAACAAEMAERFTSGGKLLAFGNGGSATDAQDLAGLFLGASGLGAPGGARPLPALCLSADVAVITSLANDVGFDVVLARQVAALARPGDIAVGLSTSGNSENLVHAFNEAGRRGLLTLGLAGYEGGRMAQLDTIDHLFIVPSASVHRIQEAQTTLYHVLWELTLGLLAENQGALPAGMTARRG